MIVNMKKTTILCMVSDKTSVLEKLRDLGILHVDTSLLNADLSDDIMQYENLLMLAEKAVSILSQRKKSDSEKYKDLSGEKVCEKAIETLNLLSHASKRLDHRKKDQDSILPWGEFSFDLMQQLKAKGIQVLMCCGSEKELNLAKETSTVEVINEYKGKYYFIVISDVDIESEKLPEITLPQITSLSELNNTITELEKEITEYGTILDELQPTLESLKEYKLEMEEGLEFVRNSDGMMAEGEIAYIQGYIPDTSEEELKETANKNGWALQLLEPEEDDAVPTLVKTPKIFEVSKPIFDFIGIAPGYREWDISTCFLIFFTIFFGMIVGDAGYGLIFLTIALGVKIVFNCQKTKLVVNLFILLSISTIIWGAINANYFGIPIETLPPFMANMKKPIKNLPSWVKGIEKYKKEFCVPRDKLLKSLSETSSQLKNTKDQKKIKSLTEELSKKRKDVSTLNGKIVNKNVQYLCFLIAAIHLSFARFWKTLLYFKTFTKALGQLGWGFIIWGNFFLAVNLIVFTDSLPDFAYYLYLVGLILVTLFSVNWKNIGDIMNFPFGLIGGFVDVLSYIRLFAVGLSTYYIADSFNNMGLMVLQISPYLIFATVIIILFGHTLNILLACMGVLVHGIRLNTLEFSNHMELEWSGFVFKPFKNLFKKDISKEE